MSTRSRPPPPDAAVREGDVLMGRYLVDRVLGSGGMGIVVAATHLKLDRRVAIKLLHPKNLSKPTVVARFAREARAAAKIKSEHVARVIDVDETDAGAPFIVMEHLEGRDLERVLAHRGPLPIEEAVDYVLQACEGIAEAHALGIVHRDLKPANLFLAKRPSGTPIVKLLDFGISKTAGGDTWDPALTGNEAVIGSPCYMSPEQRRSSARVDERTDIWSLGVVLHELVAGRPPFDENDAGTLRRLRDERPEAPEALERTILRCLEADPANRFATVAELAQALSPFAPASAASAAERISRVASSRRPPAMSPLPEPSDPALAAGDSVDPSPPPKADARVTASLDDEPSADGARPRIPVARALPAPAGAQSTASRSSVARSEPPAAARRGYRGVTLAVGAAVVVAAGFFAARRLGEPSVPPGSPPAASAIASHERSEEPTPPSASVVATSSSTAALGSTPSASAHPSTVRPDRRYPVAGSAAPTAAPATSRNPLDIQLK